MTNNLRTGDVSIDRYLMGERLYGDDFDDAEIQAWYADEESGYFDLTRSYRDDRYGYDALNDYHGFGCLPRDRFGTVLAFGCADGADVEPIASRVDRFIAVEPAEGYWRPDIAGTPAHFIKPEVSGNIACDDASVDLIVAFGVLHHVPNVTHVLSEFRRVLAPGGYLLLREPISNMGDWRHPRPGLTKRERGLPVGYLEDALARLGLETIRQGYCMFPGTHRVANKLGLRFPYDRPAIVQLDALICRMLKFNMHYHRDRAWKKVAPGSIFVFAQAPS